MLYNVKNGGSTIKSKTPQKNTSLTSNPKAFSKDFTKMDGNSASNHKTNEK